VLLGTFLFLVRRLILVVGAGVIVFLAAPVIRTVARMLLPSTKQPMIWERFSVLNRFIMTTMLRGLCT
jgi:hypothetical protein